MSGTVDYYHSLTIDQLERMAPDDRMTLAAALPDDQLGDLATEYPHKVNTLLWGANDVTDRLIGADTGDADDDGL